MWLSPVKSVKGVEGIKKPVKAGMIPLPLKTHPFQRIAMDLVGPLPRSKRGNRYILTIVDYVTRYLEAIALPSTGAVRN